MQPKHAWFKDSRSSKESSKRDWYIWKPPKFDKDGNRQPPNNWSMILGEEKSAWTYDEKTGEYFLALFTGKTLSRIVLAKEFHHTLPLESCCHKAEDYFYRDSCHLRAQCFEYNTRALEGSALHLSVPSAS